MAIRTKKLMSISVCIEPWDFRSKEHLDLSKPRELAVRLLHPRAKVMGSSCWLFVFNYRHTEGFSVLEATLKMLAEQLRAQQ